MITVQSVRLYLIGAVDKLSIRTSLRAGSGSRPLPRQLLSRDREAPRSPSWCSRLCQGPVQRSRRRHDSWLCWPVIQASSRRRRVGSHPEEPWGCHRCQDIDTTKHNGKEHGAHTCFRNRPTDMRRRLLVGRNGEPSLGRDHVSWEA